VQQLVQQPADLQMLAWLTFVSGYMPDDVQLCYEDVAVFMMDKERNNTQNNFNCTDNDIRKNSEWYGQPSQLKSSDGLRTTVNDDSCAERLHATTGCIMLMADSADTGLQSATASTNTCAAVKLSNHGNGQWKWLDDLHGVCDNFGAISNNQWVRDVYSLVQDVNGFDQKIIPTMVRRGYMCIGSRTESATTWILQWDQHAMGSTNKSCNNRAVWDGYYHHGIFL